MNRLNLSQQDIYNGYLILVNSQYTIKKEIRIKNHTLTAVNHEHPNIVLEEMSVMYLKKLIAACNGEKEIIPVSGYRTLKDQEKIYNDSLVENGTAFTRQYVALPNCSEHQTGYAIDVAEKKDAIDFICPSFPYEGICQRFRELAPDYGFIERYPKGKEDITKISHEPWHFRYVGYPHSKLITTLGFTLEEYIEFIKAYKWEEKPLVFEDNQKKIKIYYINILDVGSQSIVLKGSWQISGNNVDGVILTVWE
ncbi:D-alanyl-D-alanine dipeptidase/carboxypeptidase [Natranaerovirga hydrolytica]|uniref:D-alanyl-D-alanine dipeptidase/carboxypeptidase n=1 Tax=Natranaerovirga hydrolytica TaxID=680378 RepID=A0A4R1N5W5_9FIRM|nr:M15 family metallopeptidase [Natranaerovirga hydrolytica]TCK98013.1 D-alanyl-D-alanine dipeptidase/carboxypeptidase [Natranaerovirga hydrolytica]